MQLAGGIHDLALTEVFRLIKLSGQSGTLSVRGKRQAGCVDFVEGDTCYAELAGDGWPLASRLIKQRALTAGQVAAVTMEAGQGDGRDLASALLERDLVEREEIERQLERQIHDCVFQLLALPKAEFGFEPTTGAGGAGSPPVLMRLNPEAVILEGLRRMDEWGEMMTKMGGLEKVPHLVPWYSGASVALTRQQWRVLAHVDGRRDLLTVVEDSGIERFETVRLLHEAFNAGLVIFKDPALELLGQTLALCVRGPIDIYNATFLAAVSTSDVTTHLRLEHIEDEEVEVRVEAGVRDRGPAGSCLIYTPDSRTPAEVLRRLAFETSGFVLLVNINSRDSVVASRADAALMKEIADRPYLVATYASLADERIEEEHVRELLSLPESVPVVNCGLRDPEKTAAAMEQLIAMIP